MEQAEIFTNRYFFLAARGQLCYTKPVPTAGGVRLRRAVFLRLSMYRGLVLPRLSHQSANQQSVCVLEKRKQAQRIRGKFQGAPEFATFASPQALRANSTFIQRGAFDASEILNALTYCRKNPGKQRQFSGRVKEVRRENEIPPGSLQLTAAAGDPGRRDFCICCLDQIAIDLRIFCKKFCIFCHARLRAAQCVWLLPGDAEDGIEHMTAFLPGAGSCVRTSDHAENDAARVPSSDVAGVGVDFVAAQAFKRFLGFCIMTGYVFLNFRK